MFQKVDFEKISRRQKSLQKSLLCEFFLLLQLIEEGNVRPKNLMMSAAPLTDQIHMYMYNVQFKGDGNTESK